MCAFPAPRFRRDFAAPPRQADKLRTFVGFARPNALFETKDEGTIAVEPDWSDDLINQQLRITGVWAKDLPAAGDKPVFYPTRAEKVEGWKPKARP